MGRLEHPVCDTDEGSDKTHNRPCRIAVLAVATQVRAANIAIQVEVGSRNQVENLIQTGRRSKIRYRAQIGWWTNRSYLCSNIPLFLLALG